MSMSNIWAAMVLLSFFWGWGTGNLAQVSAALLDGAGSAAELCLSMAGPLCLWSGVTEVMRSADISLSPLFRPLLRRLMPRATRDPETLDAVSGNLSANFLGLGNAATPLGLRAAVRMAAHCRPVADDELCMLVVLNTASIQFLPVTVASIRAAAGCATPFDILPAVWVTSLCSVCVGVLTSFLLARRRRIRRGD